MSKIDVTIVNFNTCQLLLDCLDSVFRAQPNKVIVLDNASTDQSVEQVRLRYPDVIVIVSQTNRGYSAAANEAIAASSADYVLLLNSDTRLEAGALEALAHYLDQNPQVAIVGPRLLNCDGTLQSSCFHFPSLLDLFLDMSNLGKLLGYVPYLRNKYLRTWQHDQWRAVPWVLGAALAIRREAFQQANGFNETFFMYYEEVDLCYRLWDKGWQIHFAPVADIVHVGGASTRQRRSKMTVQLYTSLAHFYRLHYTPVSLLLFTLLIRCVALMRLVRDTILLQISAEPQRRAVLAANNAAWRILLFRNWQRQVSYR